MTDFEHRAILDEPEEGRGDWQGWPDPEHFTPHGQSYGGEKVSPALLGPSIGQPSPTDVAGPFGSGPGPQDVTHPFRDGLARELATPRGRVTLPSQAWVGPNAVLPAGWPASASPVADALRRPAKPRQGGGPGEEGP